MPGESFIPTETILELTGLIYHAVADSSRWPVFLETLVHAIGARRGTLALRDNAGSEFVGICWCGWSDEEMRVYNERYSAIDPWRAGAAVWPEGAVGTDVDICSRQDTESSIAFREFYAPNGAFHGMGGTILVTDAGQSLVAATRTATDGPFGELEKAILRPLMPHLKLAAQLHGELGALRRQLATFTDHLDRYSHGFLVTDADRRVLYANASAREVTAARDGLAVEDGRLTITSRPQHDAFRHAVAQLSHGRGVPLQRFLVSRPSRKKPYRLMVMPVEQSGAIALGVAVPAVSILVVDPGQRPEPDVNVLSELFSITLAEARVAGKLALGLSAEEIAAESRVSIETVRTHIKRTLSKTGTERQGELISLILRSVPLRRP